MDINTRIVQRARDLATRVHAGIYRKYIEPPKLYITHPEAVAERASKLSIDIDDRSILTAVGYTHDTLEDPNLKGVFLTYPELVAETSLVVASLTLELTNPSKNFKHLSRAERKQMDRNHISMISPEAKILKMIDRTHNLSEMEGAPIDFLTLYVSESALLLDAIGEIRHPDYETLYSEFQFQLDQARKRL